MLLHGKYCEGSVGELLRPRRLNGLQTTSPGALPYTPRVTLRVLEKFSEAEKEDCPFGVYG